MPALGADMEVGTIIEWLVKPGDTVRRGDIIAVVDTEKATIEVEVFETGTIDEIVVPQGEKVPIGTILARIRTDGAAAVAPTDIKPGPAAPAREVAPPAAAPARVSAPAPARRPAAQPPLAAVPRTERALARIAKPLAAEAITKLPRAELARLRVSPLAMRTALELKVDLSTVKGTGPHGAITKADVERAARAVPPAAPAPPLSPGAVAEPAAVPVREAPKPITRAAVSPAERQAAMRRAIAAAMVRSKREIPHYYLGTQIDMKHPMAWLQTENLKRPVTGRILYSVLLLKAVALAVHEFPEMNGFWLDGAFKPSEAVHLGVAISLHQGGGLIAPAIHDVDKKNLDEIMVNLRDLVKRVRAGVLRSSEIADATITVTSLGEQGVETVFGIIYPPQVALVGFGKIIERPWAADGMVGARPMMMATLAADHRASDGHRGALFLGKVEQILQEPEKL
jgi:pyruvate dehydrogenase E2 component (dihydrolipoamide acetyltransferase)